MFVTDYLENSAMRYPNKIAVAVEGREYTYETLLNDSMAIASGLIAEGHVNKPVFLFMEKEYLTLAAFMGVLYSRSFYSMINPFLPEFRIEKIKEVVRTDVVITNKENYEKCVMLFKEYQIYLVEELALNRINKGLIESIGATRLDVDPIYANFTSGSTGQPKGVLISNRSIIDFIEVFNDTFSFKETDIFANQAPWDFDVSTKDIYTSLKTGGTLLIVPRYLFSSPMKLVEYLDKYKPSVMIWAVSALCLVSTFHLLGYKDLSFARYVLFSGEVMPLKHLNEWIKYLPNTKFVNLYGPTEITCNCTYYAVPNIEHTKTLPIGKAFKNEEVFLLDENNSLIVDKNVPGEICVRGTCVGLGYYNNPSETAKVFVQNPLNNRYIDIIYRTKDLAYYDDNGDLVFAGRKDFQIKYQGHRIELEEIEGSIGELDGVIRAVVLFNEHKQKLIGFYVGNSEEKELLEALRIKLPSYMIPSRLIKKDEFILNKNGKIDRKLLEKEYF